MRIVLSLMVLAWAGQALAGASADAFLAKTRKDEAAELAKAPGLAWRDGDVLTFLSHGRQVARLAYHPDDRNTGDAIVGYTFHGAIRLREPGDSHATRLATAGPDGFEVSETFIVDSHGQGWLFPDSYETASPDGRYVTSLQDFGLRDGPTFIADWSDPAKSTQIVGTTCYESHWVSATEIVGACAPLIDRKDLEIQAMRIRFRLQKGGRWLMTEETPLMHYLSEMFSSFEPVEVEGFVPTARLSTTGPALTRMGPPLETLSGQ